MYRIYLDNCCLNRPLDNLDQQRVRREADAILEILEELRFGDWLWIGGDPLFYEVQKHPDPIRRLRLEQVLGPGGSNLDEIVSLDSINQARIESLLEHGFKLLDSLHIACAEFAKCDILLTTDDAMLRKAIALSSSLSVRIKNPFTWLAEVR